MIAAESATAAAGIRASGAADPPWPPPAPALGGDAPLRRGSPGLERIVGFGLCDGATALTLFGAEAGLGGLILVNPWLVEAEAGEPPAAAIRHHYRRQLLSIEGWKKILSGAVDYRKLLKGLRKISAKEEASPL